MPQESWKKGGGARRFAERAAERMIEQLNKGVAPWQKGWDKPTGVELPPYNPVTATHYRGLNSIVLRSEAQERGYADPRWVTYRGAQKIGAQVRKGERGTTVEYWKFPPKDEGKDKNAEDGKEQQQRNIIHRTYTIFNAEQVDKMPALELEQQKQFHTPEAYYSTAVHELGHWTGHESRMDRQTLRKGCQDGFGSQEYAKEELRAEMTSMTVNGMMKLPHEPERHAAYVGSWIKVLQDDPNQLRHAARDAGQMADYILQYDQQQERQPAEVAREAGTTVEAPERRIAAQREPQQVEQTPQVELSR